jgi:hypothetical protein
MVLCILDSIIKNYNSYCVYFLMTRYISMIHCPSLFRFSAYAYNY